jgi:hypothetical protein
LEHSAFALALAGVLSNSILANSLICFKEEIVLLVPMCLPSKRNFASLRD